MIVLSEEQAKALGSAVLPFERMGFENLVLDFEDTLFLDQIHNVTVKGKPVDIVVVPVDTAKKWLIEGKYLWLIDGEGLKILLEITPNPESKRGVVCHTNITGGQPALHGGELWFGDDSRVYLNNKSGRYGNPTKQQRQAVLDYFRSLGFEVVQLTRPI